MISAQLYRLFCFLLFGVFAYHLFSKAPMLTYGDSRQEARVLMAAENLVERAALGQMEIPATQYRGSVIDCANGQGLSLFSCRDPWVSPIAVALLGVFHVLRIDDLTILKFIHLILFFLTILLLPKVMKQFLQDDFQSILASLILVLSVSFLELSDNLSGAVLSFFLITLLAIQRDKKKVIWLGAILLPLLEIPFAILGGYFLWKGRSKVPFFVHHFLLVIRLAVIGFSLDWGTLHIELLQKISNGFKLMQVNLVFGSILVAICAWSFYESKISFGRFEIKRFVNVALLLILFFLLSALSKSSLVILTATSVLGLILILQHLKGWNFNLSLNSVVTGIVIGVVIAYQLVHLPQVRIFNRIHLVDRSAFLENIELENGYHFAKGVGESGNPIYVGFSSEELSYHLKRPFQLVDPSIACGQPLRPILMDVRRTEELIIQNCGRDSKISQSAGRAFAVF